MPRPKSEQGGFCKIYYKSGCAVLCMRNEYDRVKLALEANDHLIEVEDLQGDRLLVRVSEIETMADYSKAGLVVYDEEQQLLKLSEN